MLFYYLLLNFSTIVPNVDYKILVQIYGINMVNYYVKSWKTDNSRRIDVRGLILCTTKGKERCRRPIPCF